MWITLGSIVPSIFEWRETTVRANNFGQIKLEFSGNSHPSLAIKSRILVRRNFDSIADRPILVYPDKSIPVVVNFDFTLGNTIWPVVEIKKIIWKRIKAYALAEDYKVTISAYTQ